MDRWGWQARFRVQDFSGDGWRRSLGFGVDELRRRDARPDGDDAMKMSLAGAAMLAVMAVGATGQAIGQTTGVSHPKAMSITPGVDEVQQPVAVYVAPTATKPSAALKMRSSEVTPMPAAEISARETRSAQRGGDVDGMIVGDDVSGLVRAEADENIVTRIEGPSNQLPVGTMVKVRMAHTLSTKGTLEGADFTAELMEPVLRDGRVLLPSGSTLNGRVTDVHGGRRTTGPASIHLQPMGITLPDGTKYKMFGQVIDTSVYKRVKVDEEGTVVGKDHGAGTMAVLGLATGSGAAAGAMLAGWPGALIGGAVGAGIGTAVWLKGDRQTELPAGTKVVFSLTSPLTVGME